MNRHINITPSAFNIRKKLYDSEYSLVFRAMREKDNLPVILKILKEAYPSPERIARFRREYEVTRNIKLSGVAQVYEQTKYQERHIMVLEDFSGDSLTLLNISGRLSSKNFLILAIHITEILGQIHRQQIMHKDINPSNIVWNQATNQVKIIDFGISTVLSRETRTFASPGVIEGTLPYISPEQTGRMNRSVDYRTDFYSLGVTFYQLLTGQLPFQSDDPLELVHCHIAREPMPSIELLNENPGFLEKSDLSGVLKVISDIIMKLMAKNAEDRYQSAFGLKADLKQLLKHLQTPTSHISLPTSHFFELGLYDISDKFSIPQKLYGREEEIQTLLHGFTQAAKGEKSLVLVTGNPGVGKSALVNELHKPITEKRGCFISGKFDQYRRNIPYSALTQAFNQFCDLLLTEDVEKLTRWQKRIIDAVGNNGQILIDVIPHLKRVIGKQPDVAQVGPQETQNRFNIYFQYFVRAIAQADHPLTLFIDDLQWADFASLNLLKLLLSDSESRHLLIIGAYRDNEVGSGHPLLMTIDNIRKSEIPVHSIHVENLNEENLLELVSDSLICNYDYGKSLASLVYKKTLGNPFFVHQFLQSLYEEELLSFDLEARKWKWDIRKIREKGITDNVVRFMADKISKLPAETQDILKLSACVGNCFDLSFLTVISEKSTDEIVEQVMNSAKEGFLIPLDSRYGLLTVSNEMITEAGVFRFVHDRIQQAAYSLIDENLKKSLHLQIGRLLLENTLPSDLEDRIFDIVGHLNLGMKAESFEKSGILENEQIEIARLNLIAGKKAKASTAYDTAMKYLNMGLSFLPANQWQAHYDLTLELHQEAVEVAYLNVNFDEMKRLSEIIMENARTLLDKIKVYEVRIMAEHSAGNPFESVQTGLAALRLLGISFPEKPEASDFMQWLEETREILSDTSMDALIGLPKMSDPYKLAAMRMLIKVATPAYFAAPAFLPLITFTKVRLSHKYGNAPSSSVGYAIYGAILCGIAGDIGTGCRFGRLALDLLEKDANKEFKAMTLTVAYHLVAHWEQHLRHGLAPLIVAYQTGLETGDFSYVMNAAHAYSFRALVIGKALTQLTKEMEFYTNTMRQIRQESSVYFRLHQIYHQVMSNLMGEAENPVCLRGKLYDEEKMLPFHKEKKDRTTLFVIYLNKLFLSYLFGEYTNAAVSASNVESYIDGATGLYHVPLFHFYDSLTRLALGNPELLEKVAANQEKMRKWADHAPMNHLHKYYLVEAERCRVAGKDGDAREYYDKAIALAKENEYIQEEALSCELAGKFYLSKGMPKNAELYLRDAHYAYQLWGAKAKVEDLEKRYPRFVKIRAEEAREMSTYFTVSTNIASSEVFDIESILRASRTLSEEILLERLLEKMMRIVIENAGAEKGLLLLPHQKKWRIEAEGYANQRDIKVLQALSVEESNDNALMLSDSILNYVIRTQESVILNDAVREGNFTHDNYIIRQQPKSVLCMPLLNQGKIVGVLYLENNLTVGAFTPARLKMLNLLSSQMAISVENAILYNTLEQKVRERTFELNKALEEVKEANEEITDSLNYARLIQNSLLPNSEEMKLALPNSFSIWMPRDIVGGDIFFFDKFDKGFLIAVIDCTGHGVPGAFMTMIAFSGLKRIISDEGCHDPGEILKRLNRIVKTSLQQDTEHAITDDGLDAAICVIRKDSAFDKLTFAGARLPLFYTMNNEITVINGDRQSIGYKRSDLDFEYANHTIVIQKEISFYITTDGFTDQLGSDTPGSSRFRRFGKKRFTELLRKNSHLSFEKQKERFISAFKAYQGEKNRQDDITVVGFGFR